MQAKRWDKVKLSNSKEINVWTQMIEMI